MIDGKYILDIALIRWFGLYCIQKVNYSKRLVETADYRLQIWFKMLTRYKMLTADWV